jgi:hypothetical protein
MLFFLLLIVIVLEYFLISTIKVGLDIVVKLTVLGMIDFVLYNPFQLSESIAIFPSAIWKECNSLKNCLSFEGVSLVSR